MWINHTGIYTIILKTSEKKLSCGSSVILSLKTFPVFRKLSPPLGFKKKEKLKIVVEEKCFCNHFIELIDIVDELSTRIRSKGFICTICYLPIYLVVDVEL